MRVNISPALTVNLHISNSEKNPSHFLFISLSFCPVTLTHFFTYVRTCAYTRTHTHILTSCLLLLCYNIFDWTFPWGIPGALWTRVTAVWSHTHTGERSLITVRWRCVHACLCLCVCEWFLAGLLSLFFFMECGKMWLVRVWLGTKRCSIPVFAQCRQNTVLKYSDRVSCTSYLVVAQHCYWIYSKKWPV